MNVLVDQFPSAVEIDGQEYELDTDFRTALRVIMAFEDNDLAAVEKQGIMLQLLYKQIPTNTEKATEMAIKFLDGGAEDGKEEKEGEGQLPVRVYSFSKDAGLIFSAFMQTHGIDLETTLMHWWKFLSLFMDLGQDTVFCQLMALRKRVKTGKATKEEYQAAQAMGDLFIIPDIDDRTLEERDAEDEFMRLVREGEQSRG